MIKDKELYVSFDYKEYKDNKANILSSQIDLLGSIKHLENLRRIKKQKRNFKLYLHKLFSSVLQSLESLENKLPKPKIPQFLQSPEEIKTFIIESEENRSKQKAVDDELREIQAKLAQLNQ